MPVTFSFGGSGYHFPFMLGVAYALKQRFSIPWEQVHVHCISSGCAGAISLLLYTPEQIEKLAVRAITLAHCSRTATNTQEYLQLIKHILPITASQVLGTRLIIGTTLLPLKRPILYDQGHATQQLLVQRLHASCRIPMITGVWNNELDGGFSHQYAMSDNHTIVITLKEQSRSDLSARKASYFTELLLPSQEDMWALYEQGKKVVAENYDILQTKINKGLQDTAPVYFVPYA